MGNTASPNLSGFQFQSIGKRQSENQISLLKRLSSVKTSGSNEHDDQDYSTQTNDMDISEGSTFVPTAAEVDTSTVAISSVPSRRTLYQTLGNNEQVTVPVQSGPKVDIFGQRFPFVLPSSRPQVDSVNSTTVSQSVVGTSTDNIAVDRVVSLPSSSIPISKPPSDLPSIPIQSTISRTSSCASNSSHIGLTYPMSTPQSPQQPRSPFVVKSELTRALVRVPSKDHSNFSSLTQGDSSSPPDSTPTSFSPSFAALNEIHSHLLLTFHDVSSKSSETIAQASAKLASAFECASRAQNLAQESFKLTQTASSTLVDSLKAGKDSHETADKAISLVEESMKILTAYETKHAKGVAEMKEATEKVGGWIDEEQQRWRLTKEAKAKAEKELQAREKKAKEVREAEERERETQEKKEEQKKEKSAKEAQERENKKKRGPVARLFNLPNDVSHVILSGPSSITAPDPPTSHAPATLVDATDSLSMDSSFNFRIDASTSALDSLDSLDKADAWIEKLKTIEITARRAREEKEMEMERVMNDKNRQEEGYKRAEETRQRQAAEHERQRLKADQEDRRRKEENERLQKQIAAAEETRCNASQEEKQRREAANVAAEKSLLEAQLRKKAIEEREQKLRLKLEQEQEQAQAWKQAAIDEQQRRREALQQSQAGRKLGSQRATPVGNIGLPIVPIIPSIPSVVSPTPVTSTRPSNPSALPKSSVPSKPQLSSSIPTTPNVIANQTVPKLTKKQRQRARKAETLALAQQQPLSGNVPLGPPESSSLIASKVTLPTASGVRQNPMMTMSSNPDHRTSVSNHLHLSRNNISLGLMNGSASRSSNSPILHTNSTDTGNILLQSSAPKSPEVRAANMRFVVEGAGAGSRQPVAMDNSTSSASNANWRERKLAIRKSKPEYDIPIFKDEDDDGDSMECLRSPAKTTIPVVSHPTPDLSTPLLEAASNTQVSPPAGEPHNPPVVGPPSIPSASLPLPASGPKTFFDAEGPNRVGHQSRNSSEDISGDASGAGLGNTPIAPNVAKVMLTSAKSVISVPSLLEQPANNPTLTSTGTPVPLREPTSPAPPIADALRRPPSAASNSRTQPTFRATPNTSMRPSPATALSESQNQPVSRSSPRAVASPVFQVRAPIRPLSPIAPNDGGWANVRTPDPASDYSAREGRRGHNHYSPSPNSIGFGRHMSLEGSPYIPRSPPSAIGSPFSYGEQTQRDRRLPSDPDQRERSPSRPNRRGNSTSLGYGLDSGRPSNSNGQDIRGGGGRGRTSTPPTRATLKSRSRSPPVTHTGRKRSRLDDDMRDTPPFRQDHYSHQAESISRNGYKNSRRTSYPDSEHPVEAYNERLSPPNSSPTYNDIPTSLESRLSNGYDASGGTSEGFYSSSSYDRNDWVLDNRRLSPPFHHQSQPPDLPNKRQKLLDPGSADKAPLLFRMSVPHQLVSDTSSSYKGAVRGYGRGRGRGRGRGGTSYNSHSHLGPGQRHQQPAKDSLMDRLSY